VIKFVPASGAASRMFQKQLAVTVDSDNYDFNFISQKVAQGDEDYKAALEFFNKINHFAFFEKLKETIIDNGKNLKI